MASPWSGFRTVLHGFCLILLLGLTGVSLVPTAHATNSPNDPSPGASGSFPKPDMVYGQPDFVSGSYRGVTQSTVIGPLSLTVDTSGGLYTTENQVNRVLYIPPGHTTASRVYGEPDFTSNIECGGTCPSTTALSLNQPQAVAVDSTNGVYIADTYNHRVLYYPPWHDGDPIANILPTRVYGQSDFTTTTANNGGISAQSFNAPWGVAVAPDGGLYVADLGNNRVVYFPAGSTTATRVYGQSDFTSDTTVFGQLPSATTLAGPSGLAVAANGDLYVADQGNNRVVSFPAWQPGDPTTNLAATGVYGQADLTSLCVGIGNGNNMWGCPITAHSLLAPTTVGLAADGTLCVNDKYGSRVVCYAAGAPTAFRVFGQSDFTSRVFPDPTGHGVTALNMDMSLGVALTTAGDVFISDTYRNRILYYPAANLAPPPSFADTLRTANDVSISITSPVLQTDLTFTNPTAVTLPAGTPVVVTFAGAKFDSSNVVHDPATLQGGATWQKLTRTQGLATLNNSLPAGASVTLHLAIPLLNTDHDMGKTVAVKAHLQVTVGQRHVLFGTNSVAPVLAATNSGSGTNGAVQALALVVPHTVQAMPTVAVSGSFFANNETVYASLSPVGLVTPKIVKVDSRGRAVWSLHGLPSGTYQVHFVGRQSGATGNTTITVP